MGFLRQEHWSGLPFLPPGDLPHLGIEPVSPVSPELADRSCTPEPPGVALCFYPSWGPDRRDYAAVSHVLLKELTP